MEIRNSQPQEELYTNTGIRIPILCPALFVMVRMLRAKTFPLDKVMAVVAAAGKTNQRQRDLPAHVVVYYVIALTLYMQVSYREVLRCLLEGVKWLLGPEWEVKVAGKSGISQARARLGWEPLQQLHDQVVA